MCSVSIANLCLRWSEFNSIKHKIDENEFSFVRIKHSDQIRKTFSPELGTPVYIINMEKKDLDYQIFVAETGNLEQF